MTAQELSTGGLERLPCGRSAWYHLLQSCRPMQDIVGVELQMCMHHRSPEPAAEEQQRQPAQDEILDEDIENPYED